MLDDSEQQQISHLSQHIIVSTLPPPSPGRVTSGKTKTGNKAPKQKKNGNQRSKSPNGMPGVCHPADTMGTMLQIPSRSESFLVTFFFLPSFGGISTGNDYLPKKSSGSGSFSPAVASSHKFGIGAIRMLRPRTLDIFVGLRDDITAFSHDCC